MRRSVAICDGSGTGVMHCAFCTPWSLVELRLAVATASSTLFGDRCGDVDCSGQLQRGEG